jgi:hypothetical protein
MNFAQDAKGYVKIDVTAEYETPELAADMLGKAVDLCRSVAIAKGLKMLEVIEKS